MEDGVIYSQNGFSVDQISEKVLAMEMDESWAWGYKIGMINSQKITAGESGQATFIV